MTAELSFLRDMYGELPARIAAGDWSRTALGPIAGWPENLRTALGILLGSRFPMQLLWGSDYIHFYNDAYLSIAADKHPAALGQAGAQIWPELWDVVLPMLESVRASGRATWSDDMQLVLNRSGALVEGYFTFSYGPVWGEAGAVDGIFIAVTETTRRVLEERRLRTVRDLAARMSGSRSEAAMYAAVVEVLAENPHDLPFALLYMHEPAGAGLLLASAVNLGPDHPAAPPALAAPPAADAPWPFARALAAERPVLAGGDRLSHAPLPGGPWGVPAEAALVVPLRDSRAHAPMGYLVAGLSPRLALDDHYREFLDRVAAQIAGLVAGVRAYMASQEALRLRDDFLSIAAHELKNPLTPLIGRLQLLQRRLRREGVGEQHIQAIEAAAADGQRLVAAIDALLDVSRLRGGQLSIERRPFDLRAMVQRVCDDIRLGLSDHMLTLALPAEPLPIAGDMLRLEQVLRNLLANAIKYSPNGGEIWVTLALSDQYVTIGVRDQGLGIPEEARPQLFERYYRAGQAADQTIGGLGLGLFVVYEIVRLHGGSVAVESVLGVGSSFTVALPVAGS